MRHSFILLFLLTCFTFVEAQDLSYGLAVNDLELHPMQDIAKPAYLETIIDPSFGTTIRRITDVGTGGAIVPLYNTIQPWNADESLMLVYETSTGHQLLDGMTYEFIRYLDDVYPADIEQLFWDFDDPDIFYYLDNPTKDFIRYTVSTQNKEVLVNFEDITDNCDGFLSLGNDVQMMSWDSDVVGFRCNNDRAYYYRISTEELIEFDMNDVLFLAPMPAPSGDLFIHGYNVYNAEGNLHVNLNQSNPYEHSCLGRLANGNDALFAISFAEGPDGGCLGDIIAHDLTTGDCFPVISQSQGYNYSQSGTHHSALAYQNTEGGWLAASMVGYDEDGQSLLDQELVIAKADQGNVKVCRIGHHRSDENEFDFFGEPHASISPSGTRVLFASDWSGSEDGQSVDCYVVELPIFELMNNHVTVNLRVFLEGAMNDDGTMSTTLQEENLIPEIHPYGVAPYNYTMASSAVSIPNGTVDWVLVEARTGAPSLSGTSTTTTVETQVGLLGSDGYIRHAATGNALVFTELSATESYHFVVRHRNHLDIMTATSLSGSVIEYDFTTASTQAFGNAQLKEFEAENTALWTMYAGDFDHNGVLQTTDYDTWRISPAELNVYKPTDGTLDGVIQVTDYDVWFPNKAKLGAIEIRF